MTRDQELEIRQKLDSLKREILNKASHAIVVSLNNPRRSVSEMQLDGETPIESAQAENEAMIQYALSIDQAQSLKQIQAALSRLDQGIYNKCQCGRRISHKRLLAIPFAKLCLSCKKKQESKKAKTPRTLSTPES